MPADGVRSPPAVRLKNKWLSTALSKRPLLIASRRPSEGSVKDRNAPGRYLSASVPGHRDPIVKHGSRDREYGGSLRSRRADTDTVPAEGPEAGGQRTANRPSRSDLIEPSLLDAASATAAIGGGTSRSPGSRRYQATSAGEGIKISCLPPMRSALVNAALHERRISDIIAGTPGDVGG